MRITLNELRCIIMNEVHANTPTPKFKVGDRVTDEDGDRPGTIESVRDFDDELGGYRYYVRGERGDRKNRNETNMKLRTEQMNIHSLRKIIREELETVDGHLDVELADPIYRALSDTLGSRSIVKNAYYNRDRRSGAINIINADGALYIITAHELGEAGVGSREAIEWLAAHGAKQMDQTMIDRCTLNNANKRRFRSHRQWS